MKVLILSALLAVPCFAQGVTGSVTHAGTGAPVAGAVVTLHDSAGRRVGMASVADDGRYRLTAPAPGRYRVRATHVGFRPGDSGLLDVAAGMQADLTMRDLGQLLDTIRVLRTANCIRDGTSAFAVWQQLQASVASVAVVQRRALAARIIRQLVIYDRENRVQRREVNVISGFSRAPWDSPPMDSLAAHGFVLAHADGSITYRAPDLEALMSDDFVSAFCLRLVASRDPALIGISFTAGTDVRATSIAGTFWIARRTSRLNRLEFRFTGVSDAQRLAGAGGSLDFEQMRNGEWIIARWSLTMPHVQERLKAASPLRNAPRQSVTELIAVHVASGELALARVGADTLYALPPVTVHGTIRDFGGRAVRDAVIELGAETKRSLATDSTGIFRFDSVPPGHYVVTARDGASRDFANARIVVTTTDLEVELRGSPATPRQAVVTAADPPPARPDGTVLLRGLVRDTAGQPVGHANVRIQSRPATTADALGRFSSRTRPGEYTVQVRRIGFAPLTQRVHLQRDTLLQLVMTPTTVTLRQVEVTASTVDELAREGFYDRMRDRQRGLNIGYFITPEEIEARRPMRATQLMERFPGIRLRNFHQVGPLPVAGGTDCLMTIYLDGRVLNLMEERGSQHSGGMDLAIPAASIAAVELYPHGMLLPARFQMLNDTCGVIAIWTKS